MKRILLGVALLAIAACDPIKKPPPPDSTGVDSLPPVVTDGFVEPRPESPHFDFITRTYTDFCYCLKDSADYLRAAGVYDLEMSGDQGMWRWANPKIQALRYALLLSTLDEANKDPNSITGKFQEDMRAWFKAHPEFDYESAFLHDLTPGTPADSAHRLNPFIWSTKRFFLNPSDPGAVAYTVDRIRRSLNKEGVNGIFLDEMDGPNLGWIGKSREMQGKDWQSSVVAVVKLVREAISPAMLQTNAAGYSNRDFEKRIGRAAGSMHLELMNLATQVATDKWSLIDELLRDSVFVDYVAAEQWTDMLPAKWLLKYPGGNYDLPVYRAKVQQLANYYMVVPTDARRVGLQIDNTRGIKPDSVDLRIYYFDVGHPKGGRSLLLDGRDALGQRARVYRRDFDNAVVLNRPITYWADSMMTDTTKILVPLPDSGRWSYIRARGSVVPIDSLWLRQSESVILVPQKSPSPLQGVNE